MLKSSLLMDCTAFHPSCSTGGVSVYKQEILSRLSGSVEFHAFYKDVDPSIIPDFRDTIPGETRVTGNMLVWRDRAVRRFMRDGARAVWYPTQFACWLPQLPSVATIHDMAAFLAWRSFGFVAKGYMPATLIATTYHARKLLLVSETSAADLQRLFPWTRNKIVVARHGLPSDVREAATKHKLNTTDDDETRMIFLDGGNPRKRLDLCLKAIEHRGWNGLTLKVTGNAEACRGRIQRILGRIPPEIQLVGRLPRPELLQALADSDLLLYPSDFEGFGFPLIEAMAFGTSVIAFPGGAEKEVGGEFAIFAEKPDSDHLGKAITIALERTKDEPWRRQLIKHALSFTWDDSVIAHKQAFQELLDE